MRKPLIIKEHYKLLPGKKKSTTTILFGLKISPTYSEALHLQYLVFSLCKEVF